MTSEFDHPLTQHIEGPAGTPDFAIPPDNGAADRARQFARGGAMAVEFSNGRFRPLATDPIPAIIGEAIAPLIPNITPKPGYKSSEVQLAATVIAACLYVFTTDTDITARVIALCVAAVVAMFCIARRSQIKEHHCAAACEHAAELASIQTKPKSQETHE